MEAREPEHLDESVESLLRSAQPRPQPEFVLALRERLFPERTVFGWVRRPRPALVAALGAASVAAAVSVLSLAGVGPLAGRSGQDVKARSNCHFVLVNERSSPGSGAPSCSRSPGCSSTDTDSARPCRRKWSVSRLRAIARIQVRSLPRSGSNRCQERTTRSKVALVRSSAVAASTE